MTLHYADSSAWVKLVYEEPETDAMLDYLDSVNAKHENFVSSNLLTTELMRASKRLGVASAGVVDALGEVMLVDANRSTFEIAGALPGDTLRSLDAIHVATAIQVGADVFITYDDRQAEAAIEAGLDVISPA